MGSKRYSIDGESAGATNIEPATCAAYTIPELVENSRDNNSTANIMIPITTAERGSSSAKVVLKGSKRKRTAMTPNMAPDDPITGMPQEALRRLCTKPAVMPEKKKTKAYLLDPISLSTITPAPRRAVTFTRRCNQSP